MRLTTFVLAASLLAAAEPQLVAQDQLLSRFERLHPKNDERARELRVLFREAGCDAGHYIEEHIQSSKLPNIICTVPGISPKMVVVGAHYDNRGPGEGAVDNWSGASLLASLIETIRRSPHRLTFQFIGFTDEERGLIGSRDHVNHLSPQQLDDILVNVNIDCIGLSGPIGVWAGRSNDDLLTSAAVVGDETKLYVRAETLDPRYDSDASAFMAREIPSIDFHSLTKDTAPSSQQTRPSRGSRRQRLLQPLSVPGRLSRLSG